MRTHGLIYRPDGTLKASWSWQDRTRPCPFELPIEDRDDVVMIDAEHPDVPDELVIMELRERHRVMRPEWAQGRSVITVRVPDGATKEYRLNGGIDRAEPVLTVRSRPSGRTDVNFVDEPNARLIRQEER